MFITIIAMLFSMMGMVLCILFAIENYKHHLPVLPMMIMLVLNAIMFIYNVLSI